MTCNSIFENCLVIPEVHKSSVFYTKSYRYSVIMGGSHDGHGKPYEIPDWRKYKVEDCPQLQVVQRALAHKGLKDPWLRNEVWRYNVKTFGTEGQRWSMTLFRGFKFGFAAFLATIAIEKAWETMSPSSGHGHH